MAVHYKQSQPTGNVALVLGAGNVSSIGPLDILYKLFVENQVVLFKANPVNAYLGPLLEECMQTLIAAGYLRLVYGGAREGAYLCHHEQVDTIHITGSDKTFDAIVFGPGPDGSARKASRQVQISKPVTGELGNVSPVIIVPGPWTSSDIAYQAEHLASSLTNNAGFNCNASRVLIQHANWPLRQSLLQQVRQELAHHPTRVAYYPGAADRYQAFIDAHPQAEQFGSTQNKHLPWALMTDVAAEHVDDICFRTEAFCSLCAETALPAQSVVEYIERAVQFANEQLWGSLNITLIIHPRTQKEPQVAAALEQALTDLRYGTISINYWAGTSFVLGTTTWGAFPEHDPDLTTIQSGIGVVHNTLMFDRPQKSVLRAPFRSIPKPPWFASQGKIAARLLPKLVSFEAQPGIKKIPGILATALGAGAEK
jgi:acyl-CoA reductase-like NAD-dependent aldehyde dehydrogenase